MARHNSPYPLRQPYAYYGYVTPFGEEPKETFHLYCPSCQAEELEVLEEVAHNSHFIGDLMRCWVCKHEFRVTQNCWKKVVW
jgi:hypothetical protein